MTKNRNMGRRSHQAQDAELHMTEPARRAADQTGQPTRPTQHPMQSSHTSEEQPERRHSRRGR